MKEFNNIPNRMKAAIKRIPGVGPVAVRVKRLLRPNFTFTHEPAQSHETQKERALRQIRNLLNYTKTSGAEYAAVQYLAGYHTIEISGQRLLGQRDPLSRLENVPINFDGKTVLDLGTNQGGMLFAIRNRIKFGVGIDYDRRMINCANRIKANESAHNLDFYVIDIEKDPLDLIIDLMPDGHIDIVFLLSVCMWIKNWKDLIGFCAENAALMLFESNGTDDQQLEQEAVLRCHYCSVTLLSDSSEDDPGQKYRRLFICDNSSAKERSSSYGLYPDR